MRLFGRDIILGITVCNFGIVLRFQIAPDELPSVEQFVSVGQWGPLLIEKELIE